MLAALDAEPVQLVGDGDARVLRACALDSGSPRAALAFCEGQDDAARERVRAAAAQVVIVPPGLLAALGTPPAGRTYLGCAAPRRAFMRIVARCWPQDPRDEAMSGPSHVHPSAEVAGDVFLGVGVSVAAHCRIGAGSMLFPGTHLYAGTHLGERVRLDANVVVGSPGFGFERDETGRWQRFPQLARVVIEDDVEVGAGACIDRGALVDTRLGAGSKLDDRVYVAHNVVIGRNCLLMAGCTVAGSCHIEDGAVISPGASLREHIRVGRDAHVGMGAVVVADVAPGTVVAGVPARHLRDGSYWN